MGLINDMIDLYSKMYDVYMEMYQKEENIYECIVINKKLIFNFKIKYNNSIVDVDFKSFVPIINNIESLIMCNLLSDDTFCNISDFIETICINAKNFNKSI